MFPRLLIETGRVRGYLRERRASRASLVIDKENGGKADALNAGINVARFRYVCGVDADAIFYPEALLSGMRLVVRGPGTDRRRHLPPRDRGEPRAHGLRAGRTTDPSSAGRCSRTSISTTCAPSSTTGSRGRGSTSCSAPSGRSRSGGGTSSRSWEGSPARFTCEDIELTFRIHETYRREGRDYRIHCLPDTVGVTEGPDTVRKLVAQRERWQRVILETVWSYRRMLGRPRYRSVGLLGVPVLRPLGGARAGDRGRRDGIARLRPSRSASSTGACSLVVVAAMAFVNAALHRRRGPPATISSRALPRSRSRAAALARAVRHGPVPADHRLGALQGDVAFPARRQGLAQVRAERPCARIAPPRNRASREVR